MSGIIFAYGALRSGTTVFYLMLDSHHEINSPGEVDYLFDFLQKDTGTGKWSYNLESLRHNFGFQHVHLNIGEFTDAKEIALDFVNQFRRRAPGCLVLTIHRNLGKVIELFPDASFIHIVRDPRDVAKSCIDMGWAGTTYFGVEQWLKTEEDWDTFSPLLEKRPTVEVFYESLILRTEDELSKICTFLGVAYSSNMLKYPDHSTYQPPDPAMVDQWKRKLTRREICLVEMRVKRLLLARNYDLSGHPLNPLTWHEKIALVIKNLVHIHMFACRRFGIFTYVMEKVTRRFVKPLHPIFIERINKILRRGAK
jgi:hypothetical protein